MSISEFVLVRDGTHPMKLPCSLNSEEKDRFTAENKKLTPQLEETVHELLELLEGKWINRKSLRRNLIKSQIKIS